VTRAASGEVHCSKDNEPPVRKPARRLRPFLIHSVTSPLPPFLVTSRTHSVPSKRFDQARPFVTLGVVVLVWLLLPVVIKGFCASAFFELQAPVSSPPPTLRDLQDYWSAAGALQDGAHRRRPRPRPRQRLLRTRQPAATPSSSPRSAGSRPSCACPPTPKYRFEHARVARRDFSGWWQQLVIRKGRNYGIPVGAPVVFSGGVVGRVTEVHAYTAVIELISSPNVRLAGVVEGDTRPISFQGGVNPTFAPPTGVVEFVPLDITASPAAPKRLVTSGFGGVFPPGLMIGTITRASMGGDGLFQSGEVKLDERLGSLAEVTVLVPLHIETSKRKSRPRRTSP
jgi:rod shape-determining protein MreC